MSAAVSARQYAEELIASIRTRAETAGDGVDAFDAGVLIYAAVPGHPLPGRRVAGRLFPRSRRQGRQSRRDGIGSVLLLPEVMSKPLRDGDVTAVRRWAAC